MVIAIAIVSNRSSLLCKHRIVPIGPAAARQHPGKENNGHKEHVVVV